MDAYAEDVILALHGGPYADGEEAAAGKKAVGEWFGDCFSQFDSSYRFEINESRNWGDRVFVVATHRGQGRGSGVPVTQQTTYVYTVREGKVSRVEVWSDREAAFEAAGLSE